jgi:hypothetical protein
MLSSERFTARQHEWFGYRTPIRSIFQAKSEFFDDRVGEDFARNAGDLSLSGHRVETILEGKEKVLPLAHVRDAGVLHPPECPGNRLALRIQNSSLQRYIDMSLHRD